MEKKEIVLNEEQIDQIRFDKDNEEIKLIKQKHQLERLQSYLESGFMKRQSEAGLKKIKETLDSKKDETGKELDEFQLEDLEIQYKIKEREVEMDLLTTELRLEIRRLTKDISRGEKNQAVRDKQIRTKTFVQVQ